ncbi:MAG: hypothetical protein E6614_25830 [Bradyrhizobium sp.]|uniref:Uncharacterized protein n=1 Tax=Bradyrhizobium denitrificans TaxID=2734912 RepID=A0ABS5GBW3_9BRAD|nr:MULTISPECIES: hypothetical protein [Bradyrhizobium]RTM04202.1 MAG: hypothetical protein EKK32_06370 [Bradyrhizobiaceae bacterium]MBR1138764.1 hypothetical protein [Bradyrhizobium denitrificans]MCL8485956.1 hypothetical protein [Bradyrhizobium denitrificans]MDU0954821.1 hypothetical protein [Bradyrhizobium sp.]MDU1496341.1 hypothetical protein [Bradyrhizobium sp.]
MAKVADRHDPDIEATVEDADAAAALVAEVTASLAQLAQRHHLDMLDYLLRMANLEAEEHLRLRSRHRLC